MNTLIETARHNISIQVFEGLMIENSRMKFEVSVVVGWIRDGELYKRFIFPVENEEEAFDLAKKIESKFSEIMQDTMNNQEIWLSTK